MANLSAHEVRDLVIDRMMHGIYPLGSKLPTTLELARETGVHKNTIAKAYHALADLGLITLKQGRGTFVSSLVGPENRKTIATQVQTQIADLLRKARGFGLSEEEIRRTIDEEIMVAYGVNRRHAAFVECNREDVRAAVAEIEAMTGYRLGHLLLEELRSSPDTTTAACTAVFTSLFHIKEVSDLLASTHPSLSVIGVYTHPDEHALGEIAQIEPGSRVAIVCNSEESSRRFANQIATFADVTTTSLVQPSDADVLHIAEEVETIVCSRSRTSQVRSLNLRIPTNSLPFHVSQQSAGRIADALVGFHEDAVRSRDGQLLAAKGVST